MYNKTQQITSNKNNVDTNPNQDYVVINIWTSEDNKSLPGYNVGHVSVQTAYQYMSLWPAPREENISSGELTKSQLLCRRITKYHTERPKQFKTDYLDDCIAEACSEERFREITTCAELKENEVPVIISNKGYEIIAPNQLLNLNEEECLLAVMPLRASVRIALFTLDKGKVHEQFKNLKNSITGWQLIGSNILTRNLKEETAENCVTLAFRLLKAGGMYVNLSSFLTSKNSSIIKPDDVLKQVVAAKEKELKKEGIENSEDWSITEVLQNKETKIELTSISYIKLQYKIKGETANAEEDLSSNDGRCFIF